MKTVHELTENRDSVAGALISITELAKLVPGRPSTNCVWRWCRKGVRSRNGERVRLQHVRIGGKIFSKTDWLNEFGAKLAESDTRYFELSRELEVAEAAMHVHRARSPSQAKLQRCKAIEDAEGELKRAGI